MSSVTEAAGAGPGLHHVDAVRRKPGKGLVVMAHGDSAPPRPRLDLERTLMLELEEDALSRTGAGMALRSVLGQGDGDVPPAHVWPIGDDAVLPALRPAIRLVRGDSVWQALETAVAEAGEQLEEVVATLVRYKPHSRCVVRYTVRLGGAADRECTVYGKLFADTARAAWLDDLVRRLVAAGLGGEGSWSAPAPLGVVAELGLGLSAPAVPGVPRSLGAMLKPPHGDGALNGGEVPVPAALLEAAATGLARLHALDGIDGLPHRSAADDASSARRRGSLLAGHVPALAQRTAAAAAATVAALESTTGVPTSFCHGGFKPAQFVVGGGGELAVTDWDGACRSDPALDVGYFLAYLRPASLWRGSDAARRWFDAASSVFISAYQREARAPSAQASAMRRRAAAYEAALLFKIACRRVNRLNAPRPVEMGHLLAEIEACLAPG